MNFNEILLIVAVALPCSGHAVPSAAAVAASTSGRLMSSASFLLVPGNYKSRGRLEESLPNFIVIVVLPVTLSVALDAR